MVSGHQAVARTERVRLASVIGAAIGLTAIGALVAHFGADAVIRSLLAIGWGEATCLNVNFPDLPNGWSQGETRDEALAQADDLLDEMLLGSMAHNEDVPRPSPRKGRPRSWLCQP